MKVGELFGELSLDDDMFTRGLRQAEAKASRADLDARGALGIDDGRFDAAMRQADGQLDRFDSTVATATIDADTSGFDQAGSDIEDAIGGWEGGVTGAAALLGSMAGMELASSFQDALDSSASTSRLGAQLGVDPDTAGQLGFMAGDIYAQNFGESEDQIKEAQRRMWQNGLLEPGIGRADAERYTTQFLAMLNTFDGDESMMAQALAKMVDAGLVANQQEALDLMARGLQSNANNADDLAETFQEYSTQFRELGIDGATAMGLMSQGLHGTARDADTVADGLKNLAIEAQSGSEASRTALEALGIAPEEAAAAFRQGGDAAREMTTRILDRMRATRGSVDEVAVGVGLMGSKWEDMQDAVYSLDPSTAASAFGEIDGAAQDLSDTLSNNTASSIEKLKRSFQVDLSRGWQALMEDPGQSLSDFYVGRWISAGSEVLGWMGGAVEQMEGVVGRVPEFLGGVVDNIESFLGGVPERLGAIFDPLEDFITAPVRAGLNTVSEAWNALEIPEIGPFGPFSVEAFGRSIDVGPFGPWGPFDLGTLPTFHTGGEVRAAMPGGEVVAKLLDGERVLNRAEAAAYRTGRAGQTVNYYVRGSVVAQRELESSMSASLRRSGRARR